MLKGEKIYLRLLERKDVRILYRICNEKKVKKYNTIYSPDEKNNIQNTNLRKALSIINEKEVVVGFVTYKQSSYCKRTYIIGITIGSRFWNRGYGQDAIKVLVKYLFEELDAVKVELETIAKNYRAINCYKKCGFVEERVKKNSCLLDNEYLDTVVMGILRKETY